MSAGPKRPLNPAEVELRRKFLRDQEAQEPERWTWMSFADPRQPEGERFLGVVITKARGLLHAIDKAYEKGVNPGGEVVAFVFPEGKEPPAGMVDRLLSRQELKEAEFE